jgi:hypothetical protein
MRKKIRQLLGAKSGVLTLATADLATVELEQH